VQPPEVYVDTRLAWRGAVIPVPPGLAKGSWDASVSQRAGSLAGSTSTLAFVHSADVTLQAKCRKSFPPCMVPDMTKTILGELWRGPASGPFHRIAGGRNGPIVLSADVSGTEVAYTQVAARRLEGGSGLSRVVLVRDGRRPVTLASSRKSIFDAVAVAGDYAAWLGRPTGAVRYPQPFFTITVYDLRRSRVAYRLGDRALAANNSSLPFDVAADGTVAFVSDRSPRGGCDGGIGWASPRSPRAHFLPGDALQAAVRLARGRIAFLSRPSCTASGDFTVVVATLDGRRTSVASLASIGGFDFDGRRVAYVADGAVHVVAAP
jgi:hypothetical protein